MLAPSDTWLDAITAMLKAVYNEQFTIGVNRDGSIYFRKYETIDEIAPVFVYTDDNASILLPTVNTSLDLYKIPNVIELIYSGEGGTYRSIAKNEDESSVVSISQRKREIRKRVILNRVPRTADSIDQAYFDNYARDLLEQVSTISQEISFSHGYCGTKVGDVVLINYTRAGLNNVKGRIISQTINCVPGCTVDETIVYTKKLWVNKNVVYEDDEPSEEEDEG